MSVELDEILALADRILVMHDGRIVGDVLRAEATERALGLMMAGVRRRGDGAVSAVTGATARWVPRRCCR